MAGKLRNIDDVLVLLKGVKQQGKAGQYAALCPGHGDKRRSLSVKQQDGKILIKCFAGCELASILKPLNLEPADLFINGRSGKGQNRQIVAVYQYDNFEVCRTMPKGFFQRRADGNGGFIYNLKGTTLTLYHQSDLQAAIGAGRPIFIVEGEKDVDRLLSEGIDATCNPMGAGKWQDEYNQALIDADVIIIPDDDEPGHAHANQIARSLYGKARRIRILKLPNAKDVSEWLDAGHKPSELFKYADLISDFVLEAVRPSGPVLRYLDEVKPKEVKFLWKPYMPVGKLSMLEGDPGVGKSWVTLAIATAISRGQGLPPAHSGNDIGMTLIASAEDGLADTIRPRLDIMGAEMKLICAIDGLFTLDEAGFVMLEDYIKQVKPILLIIDPLVAYMSKDMDPNKANQVRYATARLSSLAEYYNLAVLAVRHLTKGGSSKAIYRGLGSIDFTAAARSVLLAGNDPDDPDTRGLVHIKTNLAPKGPAIGYRLSPEYGFQWLTSSNLTADIILQTSNEDGSALSNAKSFLQDVLSSGPQESNEVYTVAEKQGISKATLNRAKVELKVINFNQAQTGRRGAGRWFMRLPDGD